MSGTQRLDAGNNEILSKNVIKKLPGCKRVRPSCRRNPSGHRRTWTRGCTSRQSWNKLELMFKKSGKKTFLESLNCEKSKTKCDNLF